MCIFSLSIKLNSHWLTGSLTQCTHRPLHYGKVLTLCTVKSFTKAIYLKQRDGNTEILFQLNKKKNQLNCLILLPMYLSCLLRERQPAVHMKGHPANRNTPSLSFLLLGNLYLVKRLYWLFSSDRLLNSINPQSSFALWWDCVNSAEALVISYSYPSPNCVSLNCSITLIQQSGCISLLGGKMFRWRPVD